MPVILPVRGIQPRWGERCFIAPNATIVGDVVMGDDCSVWFTTVVRGDVNAIRIGNKVNIQDGAIIHCTYQQAATTIGDFVSIGHRAIVHGCTIGDSVLIGMGAIVMDRAQIGSHSIIAAGSVVLEGTIVESGTIYGGIPARKLKDLDPKNFEHLIQRIGTNYAMYADWFINPQTTL
jgi:carbonic anhydrase/acetyltransferase-like protein (isoleucine patch superfamily)